MDSECPERSQERIGVRLFQPKDSFFLSMLIVFLFVSSCSFPVHGVGETYTLTTSATRLQETTTSSILLILNVTNANTVSTYAFTWHVKDPSASVSQASNQTGVSHGSSFVESVAYPGKFGTSIDFVGTYTAWVNQTQPLLVGSTGVGTPVQFRVGLTDSISYQRTLPVAIVASGYKPNLNVTIRISGQSGLAPNFPTNKTANNNGDLSYVWASIPASIPVGNYTVSLSGNPTKNPPDVQSFTILPANVTISQLTITRSLLQRSQTEDFRFSAAYPNGAQVRTGGVSLLLVEPDGSTSHYVPTSYSSALNMFRGTYQIPLSSQSGPWVATIEVNTFDDGYGDRGPLSGVFKPFTVTPATLAVSVLTAYSNYTIGDIVAIYTSVVTPGGDNLTSGTVTATTYYSTREIGSPLQLFYDQSRGKWVGSYTINSTNPAGIWQIQVNATDTYGNAGQGSTSTLVSNPTAPQQSSTFNYLLVVVIALLSGLAVLVSWIVFGRRRVLRRVLKVDLEAIHAEARKVENQDFFKKVQQQLKQQKEESGKSDHSG